MYEWEDECGNAETVNPEKHSLETVLDLTASFYNLEVRKRKCNLQLSEIISNFRKIPKSRIIND